MAKFTVKKFDGDDSLSYAVFRAEDVKGMGHIICYGQARPLMSGMSRMDAQGYKRQLESEHKQKSSKKKDV